MIFNRFVFLLYFRKISISFRFSFCYSVYTPVSGTSGPRLAQQLVHKNILIYLIISLCMYVNVGIVEKIMVPVFVNILPLHMFFVLTLIIIKYLILFITKLSTYEPSFHYFHIFFSLF